MKEIRDKFEAIAKTVGLDVSRHEKYGFYLCRSTLLAWICFMAAYE